jgi:hypothetical protein
VDHDQVSTYRTAGWKNVIGLPKDVKGISRIRSWILRTAVDDVVVMMDDDLSFYVRGPKKDKAAATPFSLYTASDSDVSKMLRKLDKLLSTHAHAGISPREGNNRVASDVVFCTRMMRVIAYNKKLFGESGCDFHDSSWFTMDDFDMTLQLLRAGFANAVVYDYCNNQKSSNTPGGASDYRTSESHARSAREVKRRHPEFVRLATKATKTSWGGGMGGERLDIVASWKKAYESSLL